MEGTIKWNPINGNHGIPKSFGTYLITVASIEDDGIHYHESRMTMEASLQKIKSGYCWIWEDDNGTNCFHNTCENRWADDNIEYCDSIVAWASVPAPYTEDWSATLSTIKRDSIKHGVTDDGAVTVDFWREV